MVFSICWGFFINADGLVFSMDDVGSTVEPLMLDAWINLMSAELHYHNVITQKCQNPT